MDSSLCISHSKGEKISKNLKLFGRFQNSWLTTESNWWLKQFNIWLRRWLAETCSVAVAPHNSDLFGQCNYPSQATGERPSDQLAQWLVSCKYPDKVKTAVSDHWPSQTQPSWIMVEPCLAPAQACDDGTRHQRFSRTRLGWLQELSEIESGSRGILLTPQKRETDRGKNGKHWESLARLKNS